MSSIKVNIYQAYHNGKPWKCYTESICSGLDKLEPELNVGQFDHDNDYRPEYIKLAGVIAKAACVLQKQNHSLTILMHHNEDGISRQHGLRGKLTRLVPLSDDEIAKFDQEFERMHDFHSGCD